MAEHHSTLPSGYFAIDKMRKMQFNVRFNVLSQTSADFATGFGPISDSRINGGFTPCALLKIKCSQRES
jgi:hypothetical protein